MSRLATVAAAILVALWLLLASFMIVLAPPTTFLLAGATVDTQSSALPHDYLVSIASATRDYCAGLDAQLPVGSDERVAFTPQVMQHLDDVRTVFVICQWAAVIITIIFIGYLLFAVLRGGVKRRRQFARALLAGSLGVLVLVIALVLIGLLSFNALFTAMHRVFFAEGSWLFAYDSLLICALPEAFWMGCAIVWAAALLLLCVIAIAVAVGVLRGVSRQLGSARHCARE